MLLGVWVLVWFSEKGWPWWWLREEGVGAMRTRSRRPNMLIGNKLSQARRLRLLFLFLEKGCFVFVWLQVVRDFFLSSWASSCWMLWMEILSYYVESNGNRTWVSILLMQMWYICGFLNLKRKKREKKNKESHNGQILIFILFWVLILLYSS